MHACLHGMGVLYNCIEEVGGFFTVVLVDLFFIRRLLNQKFPVIWFYEVYKGSHVESHSVVRYVRT
jgi:hypothetical protein